MDSTTSTNRQNAGGTSHQASAKSGSCLLRPRSILVPVDFSESSVSLLEQAATAAKQCGADLSLLHVIAPDAHRFYSANARDRFPVVEPATVRLMCLARQIIPRDIRFDVSIQIGEPHEEISASAKLLGSDLIMISTHGYTGLKHLLLGSNAEKIVRHAPCPVLVVHTVPKVKTPIVRRSEPAIPEPA